MTKDEALKLALEALEWINRVNAMDYEYQQKARESLNAIYEALAEQEPVAWEQFYPDIGKPQIAFNSEVIGYVAPQRTWVGLTDDEIWEAYMKAPLTLDCSTDELYALARTVEAKLKDKNNG